MKFVVQICISVIQIRTSVKKFSVYIIQIKIRVESIQIRHRSGQRLNWMAVLRTCCIFREFERHKFRFDWRQCKFECWENKIEWQIGCAWPKSSKLNAHKMNLVDKITKLTGKTYIIIWTRYPDVETRERNERAWRGCDAVGCHSDGKELLQY